MRSLRRSPTYPPRTGFGASTASITAMSAAQVTRSTTVPDLGQGLTASAAPAAPAAFAAETIWGLVCFHGGACSKNPSVLVRLIPAYTLTHAPPLHSLPCSTKLRRAQSTRCTVILTSPSEWARAGRGGGEAAGRGRRVGVTDGRTTTTRTASERTPSDP